MDLQANTSATTYSREGALVSMWAALVCLFWRRLAFTSPLIFLRYLSLLVELIKIVLYSLAQSMIAAKHCDRVTQMGTRCV